MRQGASLPPSCGSPANLSVLLLRSVAEVESEQMAAHRSVMDVLEGFAGLFGQQAFQRPAPAPAPAAPQPAAGSPAADAPAAAGAAGGAAPEDQPVGEDGPAAMDSSAAEGQRQPQQQPQQQQPSGKWAAAAQAAPSFRTLDEALAEVRGRLASGQMLWNVPLQAMRLLLAGVQPAQLQWDVEEQLPAAEAATASTAADAASAGAAAAGGRGSLALPPFALVSPKLAALVGQLMQYRPAALAATAAAATAAAEDGEGGEGCEGRSGGGSSAAAAGWCGIVFVSQRMAAWALHKILRWLVGVPGAGWGCEG